MFADAVLRLAVAVLPAASRDRYRAEWTTEVAELPPRQRIGFATRVLARTPQLRFALRPVAGRQLVGGGVVGTEGRRSGPLATVVLAVLAVLPVVLGALMVVAAVTVRSYCAAGACVPLESASAADGDAFRAGPIGWTAIVLYTPLGPFALGVLSIVALPAIYAGLSRAAPGSWVARFFAVSFILGFVLWAVVGVFAPEMAYVNALVE